jgi:Protein of unknown function (DUF4238)
VPTNKNQHFVPKALFKPFTIASKGISMDMLLLKSGQFKENISVSDQCSKANFYGNDHNLESAIQSLEGYYGIARDEILAGTVAAHDDNKKLLLKRFILFQHYRTLASAINSKDAMIKLREGLLRLPNAKIEPMPDQRLLMQFVMEAYVENMSMLDDLSLCFLRNSTKIDFVIGDDPAVHTNRWQLQKLKRSTFGPGHAGTIFLMPVSPRITALLYDRDTYALSRTGIWLDIKRETDATFINQMQFSNAQSSIYLSEKTDKAAVIRQFDDFNSYWPQRLRNNSLRVAELAEEMDDFKKYSVLPDDQLPRGSELFVHVQQQHAQPPRWPTFLRYRHKPLFVDTKSSKGFIRKHTASWHHGSDWV